MVVHDQYGSSAGRHPAFRPVIDSVSPAGPSPAPVPPGGAHRRRENSGSSGVSGWAEPVAVD